MTPVLWMNGNTHCGKGKGSVEQTSESGARLGKEGKKKSVAKKKAKAKAKEKLMSLVRNRVLPIVILSFFPRGGRGRRLRRGLFTNLQVYSLVSPGPYQVKAARCCCCAGASWHPRLSLFEGVERRTARHPIGSRLAASYI